MRIRISKKRFYGWLLSATGAILLSAPFILIAVLANPLIGVGGSLLIITVPVVLILLIYTVRATRAKLERSLKELGALNQISQVLLSSLELKNLLAVLQIQIRELLRVENFYLALYNQEAQQIWYPLVVKRGQLLEWLPRPLMDRLTDRVIREGNPFLLSLEKPEELASMVTKAGEKLADWMGVPLVSVEQAISCLGVYALSNETLFTEADLQVLRSISSQVSLAVENALLQEQVQQRTTQLEKMNQIANLIADQQDLGEVLRQVCRAVIEVGCAEKSAIFLANYERGEVSLAYAEGFSKSFKKANPTFLIGQDRRTRSMQTGRTVFVSDVDDPKENLDSIYLASLRQEDVRAFADFPLITPEGQIGYLSVFSQVSGSLRVEQVKLVQAIAAQAALSLSSARLYTRAETALARRANQLSILELVSRELSAAIQSEGLFESILGYAMQYTRSGWGMLALIDRKTQALALKAWQGYPIDKNLDERSFGLRTRAIHTRQPVNVSDLAHQPGYGDLSGGKARSLISQPLVHQDQVLGFLSLESTQPNAYTGLDLTFITQLANHAAVALANAELLSDVAQGRDHLEAVIHSVSEGIMMIESGGLISLVNPFTSLVTGLPQHQLVGVKLDQLDASVLAKLGFTAEQARTFVTDFERTNEVTLPKTTYQLESPPYKIERTISIVYGHDEQAIGWLIVLRDVTEEQRIAQERELLTETMVHDLRSPLGAILGALDFIQEELDDHKESEQVTVLKAVAVARRGSQRVLGLVDSVLDIAGWESGGMALVCNPFGLIPLIVEVVEEYQNQASDYGVTLLHVIQDPIPTVYADREKIRRVLSNLADNALKFTPSGGQVVFFACLSQEGFVEVQVSDTGPGIPLDYRQKIFEKFSLVPGQSGRRRGSGLGLTFCKLAVQAHGGKIWVVEREGGGSMFIFTIPLDNQHH